MLIFYCETIGGKFSKFKISFSRKSKLLFEKLGDHTHLRVKKYLYRVTFIDCINEDVNLKSNLHIKGIYKT